jgi:hypothetical protein
VIHLGVIVRLVGRRRTIQEEYRGSARADDRVVSDVNCRPHVPSVPNAPIRCISTWSEAGLRHHDGANPATRTGADGNFPSRVPEQHRSSVYHRDHLTTRRSMKAEDSLRRCSGHVRGLALVK